MPPRAPAISSCPACHVRQTFLYGKAHGSSGRLQWSLQPQSPAQLVDCLKEIGVHRVQLALDPFRTNPDVWGTFPALAAANNISVVSGMLTTVKEDYTTMESIWLTGGIVPDSTWDENWENIQAIARIAESMQIGLMTFHAGFAARRSRPRICQVVAST